VTPKKPVKQVVSSGALPQFH